jgi:hypothetical protein
MTATSVAGIAPTARRAPNDGVRRQVQAIAAQHAQRRLVHRRWRALDVLQYRRLRAGARRWPRASSFRRSFARLYLVNRKQLSIACESVDNHNDGRSAQVDLVRRGLAVPVARSLANRSSRPSASVLNDVRALCGTHHAEPDRPSAAIGAF